MTKTNRRRICISLVVLFLILPLFASAQGKKKGGGDRVIRLEDITIVGRVQKPNAFFINTRQALVYDMMEVRESFVEEIGKIVEKGPF